MLLVDSTSPCVPVCMVDLCIASKLVWVLATWKLSSLQNRRGKKKRKGSLHKCVHKITNLCCEWCMIYSEISVSQFQILCGIKSTHQIGRLIFMKLRNGFWSMKWILDLCIELILFSIIIYMQYACNFVCHKCHYQRIKGTVLLEDERWQFVENLCDLLWSRQ